MASLGIVSFLPNSSLPGALSASEQALFLQAYSSGVVWLFDSVTSA